MTEFDALELFPVGDDKPSDNVLGYPTTGVISYQGLRHLERAGELAASGGLLRDQFQPASVDLRLGRRAFRVRASFLPGAGVKVLDRVRDLDSTPEIDLSKGAVFERGIVYVVELQESVRLTNGLVGYANPKSSTGRLDVLARLITDGATAFDRVERKYTGPLYLEVAPQMFSIVVHEGDRLNQLRFHRGTSPEAPKTVTGGIQDLYDKGQLVRAEGQRLPLRQNLVPVTVDLRGSSSESIVGYKARATTDPIDLTRIGHYDPRDFWEKIEGASGHLYLDRGDFYILATAEEVGVPPNLAAEMVPYDSASGEFRVHYAGFFDPGFGWNEKTGAGGSKAVLEVRSYGVSFMLEHGQTVGWLNYHRLASGPPEIIYGADIKSHYQGQGVKLGKHFKPWPQ